MASIAPEFEIPLTPELSSASSTASSNDSCSFFSVVSASDVETEFPNTVVPLRKEHILPHAGVPRKRKNIPLIDTLFLRGLPSLDTHDVDYEGTSSLMMTDASMGSGNSQMPLLGDRSFSLPPSRGVFRRASDKGPTSTLDTLERERRVSMLNMVTTTFSPEDTPRKSPNNSSRRRTIRFMSPQSPKRQFRRPQSPHPHSLTIHANTDALARLAWTGEFLSPSNDAFFQPRTQMEKHNSWHSTWSSPDDDSEFNRSPLEPELETNSPTVPNSPRPMLFRRCPSPDRHKRRRWTLALAITDEALTDEALVDELEKMRRRDKIWEWEWRRNPDSPLSPLYGYSQHRNVDSPTTDEAADHRSAHLQFSSSSVPLNIRWKIARHALLVCREIVRTERHYHSSLCVLRSKETSTKPPVLMMSYLPALIQSSETFLARIERNPSAQGVADAFVAAQAGMEQALVSWCGVVGSFFVGIEDNTTEVKRSSGDEGTALKKRVGSWGKRVKSFRSYSISKHKVSDPTSHSKNKRNPRVRDLAILPSQQVVRYVLLYKDLLAHTPSPLASRGIVEQALQAALSIAQRCDKAQKNSSFLLPTL